jgi:hypothetical protein
MMPSTISHDLMRTNEQEMIRATRYAHHRAHTYRRPGPFLALLLEAWMSKVPALRHRRTTPKDPTPEEGDSLRLVVADLGGADIDGVPAGPVPSGRIA